MANLEPSCSDSRYSYDVFLSFRGKDTRNTFTDHLYTALVKAGHRTFRDEEEIRTGEDIKSELVDAIQQSRGSIIVFSKNYASSRWCLDELAMIMALKKNSGSLSSKFVVLPVFYDVDPTNIRRQSGIVREAFAKYEERINGEKDEVKVKELREKVNSWKEALTEAADLSGMVLQQQSERKESKFIQKVVKVISDNIDRPVFHINPHLIGIQERAKSINKWLEDESTDVNVIGICGMGGIGKTTIAKFVYNQNFGRYEGSCFLANVREMSKQPNGLASLQNQLLSDVTKGKKEQINDVDEGIVKIKYAISCKRILLVLDDVDHQDQLNAILGMRDWCYPGSRIIITTRHERLLKLPEVDKVYKVENFTDYEAIELMSYHAFGTKPPKKDFINLTMKAAKLCGGLPLAIQVIGSSLSGQKTEFWVSALEKLENIPNSDILEKLKISYDSLQDDHDKNLFLHIACFFVGQDKNILIRILDECEFYTTVGIQNLIDRSLITADFNGKLMMHQLLQDMGREIVRLESPRYLGERSRLWRHKESFDVLKMKTGTKAVEGLVLNMQMVKIDKPVETESRDSYFKRSYFKEFTSHQDNPQKRRRVSLISWLSGKMSSSDSEHIVLETDAFERMQNLKLLQLNYAKLTGSYGSFPQKLRLLCWHGFPLKAIPINLSLDSMVFLDMQHSSLRQVWQGIRFLASLKILNLSYSKELVQTPNFSGIPKLERLMLRGCISLSEVCESIGVLEGLIILDLEDCRNLRKLPASMCKLSGLQTLNLSGCPNVMRSLGVLLTDGIPINSVGTTFTYLSWIAFPWNWLSKCRSFADICTSSLPSRLRRLNLSGCNLFDESLPQDFSSLSLLCDLYLSNNPLRNLPECIRTLGITFLDVGSCKQLQSLHGLPETLRHLDINDNPSLEIVTSNGDIYFPPTLSCLGCPKLAKMYNYFLLEHITEVDRQIIDNLGFQDVELMGHIGLNFYELPGVSRLNISEGILHPEEKRPIQGLHEFGIFSTFVPGFAVPSWYSESKVMGPSISFMVPPNVRIQCLNVCCLYGIGEDLEKVFWHPNPTLVKINNKTKDLTWIYCPLYSFYLSDDDDNMAWLSQWKFWDYELCGGDQVTVTFAMGNSLKVTECGYNFVFHEEKETETEEEEIGTEEEEGIDSYPAEEEWGVIGGDLSNFKLSTGAYFLGRDSFYCFEFEEEDWTTRKWFRDIFGDSITSKEFNKLTWAGFTEDV